MVEPLEREGSLCFHSVGSAHGLTDLQVASERLGKKCRAQAYGGCRMINAKAPPPSVSLPFPRSSSRPSCKVNLEPPVRCRRMALAIKDIISRVPNLLRHDCPTDGHSSLYGLLPSVGEWSVPACAG
jgi:hypothetical protein